MTNLWIILYLFKFQVRDIEISFRKLPCGSNIQPNRDLGDLHSDLPDDGHLNYVYLLAEVDILPGLLLPLQPTQEKGGNSNINIIKLRITNLSVWKKSGGLAWYLWWWRRSNWITSIIQHLATGPYQTGAFNYRPKRASSVEEKENYKMKRAKFESQMKMFRSLDFWNSYMFCYHHQCFVS